MPGDKLNPQQELFCKYYTSDREFFGNGTQSYIEAYDVKPTGYKAAMVSAHHLLSNPKIINRINKLLEEGGLNDQFVDKQLHFLITQYSDYKAKASAIKEYNALKNRVKQRVEFSGSLSLEGLFEAAKKD